MKRINELFRIYLIQIVVLALLLSWLVISGLVLYAEHGQDGANISTYGKALWWGVVTFLTVGYGDYYPVTASGKMWASILMCEGVLSVAIITSKISSYFLEQVLREGRGTVNTSLLNGHFVVCGWKEEMHELLIHILDMNRSMKAEDIVLIANAPVSEFEALKELDRLKGVRLIQGDYYEASSLSRAAPERAKKILILADRTPNQSGSIPSRTEIDSRTIITAMTLANIARGTLVAAEILDPKMDQYLKMASVSEVIYSRQYSRFLLGNAAGGTGVVNIIFDLLDPQHPTNFATHVIPEGYFGGSFLNFKRWFEERNEQSVVIGILENTGNSQSIKELALREAQKTPDVARLVQNLKSVKQLKCNYPVFNPDINYKIPLGAMAIVIETRKRVDTSNAALTKEEDFARAA